MSKKYLIFTLFVTTLILLQCGSPGSKDKPEIKTNVDIAEFNIRFMATPPPDLDSAASPQQLAEFAWEEFLALNWQASYPKDGKRDAPDLNWSYKDTSAYPSLVVWETFAHRAELRPYSNKMLPFDAPPHYDFGITLPPYPNSKASFNLFDALDENNEIGSCDVYARVNKYQKQYQVLYQAKVNRDEYEYIRNKYPTKDKLIAATTYNLAQLKKYKTYGTPNSCDCGPSYPGVSLPCGNKKTGAVGAMEVKTAWRELTTDDDKSKFFKRKVIYFRIDPSTGKYYYDNKEYALIAIHIIHKTRNYDDFVFATWEHVDVEKDNMGLVELDTNGHEKTPLPNTYKRLHPISKVADQATASVHAQLKSFNPKSIWLNYRLVGVQGTPTDDTNSDSFFLANYVVESDSTLANFHGSGIGKPHDGGVNTYSRGKALSVGGCQGCHGVAQGKLGGDFSFLMDTIGKPVKMPDVFNYGDKYLNLIKNTSKK